MVESEPCGRSVVRPESGIYGGGGMGCSIQRARQPEKRPQAERLRSRKEAEFDLFGQYNVAPIGLREMLSRWLQARPDGVSLGHRREMEAVVSRFLRVMGVDDIRSDRVSPETVDNYVRLRLESNAGGISAKGRPYELGKRPTAGRLKGDLRMLRALFNFGLLEVRPRCVAENPVVFARAAKIRHRPQEHQAIGEAEFRALLEAAATLPAYALILLGWFTGARRGELLRLKWRDVSVERQTVEIDKQKTGVIVRVPLPADVVAALAAMRGEAGGGDLIFAADPLAGHGFAELCQAAGVEHHRFQDFRLTASTRLRAAGVDGDTAGRLLGHSPAIALKFYSDMTAIADRIGPALAIGRCRWHQVRGRLSAAIAARRKAKQGVVLRRMLWARRSRSKAAARSGRCWTWSAIASRCRRHTPAAESGGI